MRAIGPTGLVVDVTVEGILHSPARQELLSTGGRVYMISLEHPEVLERCMPNPALIDRVDHSLARLDAAKTMRVTSAAGTDLTVDVNGAPVRGGAGFLTEGQPIAYWPAGLALCFPLKNTVNGTVVLNVGDVNLTFKRYFESPVRLTVVFLDLLKGKNTINAVPADVVDEKIAEANAKETGKVQKGIISDFIKGENGRKRHKNWVPNYMQFPFQGYTDTPIDTIRIGASWLRVRTKFSERNANKSS